MRQSRVIVAPNAFKGSLSAAEAAAAVARGWRAVFPEWVIHELPLADGGDGTTACIVQATGGRIYHKTVTGPLGGPVDAFWGLTGDGATAVVEVAAASGLALVPPEQRDPLQATSFGTGELIREAIASGCRTVFVGLGGSACSDAGAGILQALGARLLDKHGREIGRGAASLHDLDSIDVDDARALLSKINLVAGCDVDNPLFGPEGAAYVYAPQKGAKPEQLPFLDQALRHFAAVVKRDLNYDVSLLPGGGAAGGIGAGLAILGGRLVPGVETIMELTGLPALLDEGGVKLVITGEGEINRQSLRGKVPVGVARLAQAHQVPVLVLAGSVKLDPEEARSAGISAMLSITDGPLTLAEAMAQTAALLEKTAAQAARLLKIGLAGI